MHHALLRMDGIAKRFGATEALRGVSLQLHGGEVLALIGENGAGKSTLMKILSGALRPDAGTLQLDGAAYAPSGPHDALRRGVAMIYQELNLAPDLSVEDNIMLGQEERAAGIFVHRAAQRRRVREALALLGHPELSLHVAVRELSPGAQQLVEIARALVLQARVIVFDEPTSSLTGQDVEHLFAVIGRLRQRGLGLVYISHFLEEVFRIADRYTVLRDGQSVGTGSLREVSEAELVTLMAGRRVQELFPRVPHHPGEVLLQVDDLHGQRQPCGVSLQVRRGEILGVAGLVGAGRTELLRCIYALDAVRTGRVRVAQGLPRATPRARIRAGLGLLSEDRKSEGLAQARSVADNLTYSRLEPYRRFGFLRWRRRRDAVREWMQRLGIRARHESQSVEQLSGGNQQKVALARILHQDADVLLLDEPTRGIDVGTKAEIYRLMGHLAASGKAVIFVSSYFKELLAVCDRIAVMVRGRLREVRPAQDWTEESLLAAALGSDREPL
jgi:ribose transport system ATP-binding protein